MTRLVSVEPAEPNDPGCDGHDVHSRPPSVFAVLLGDDALPRFLCRECAADLFRQLAPVVQGAPMPAADRPTVKIPRSLWSWRRLPLGTRAHAVMGGWWERTSSGWKANGGDTFPTPGGDVVSVEVPCLTDEDMERLRRYIEADLLVSLDMAMALGELAALRLRTAELDLRIRGLSRRVDEAEGTLSSRRKRDDANEEHNRAIRDGAMALATYVAGARGAIAENPGDARARGIISGWGELADRIERALKVLPPP